MNAPPSSDLKSGDRAAPHTSKPQRFATAWTIVIAVMVLVVLVSLGPTLWRSIKDYYENYQAYQRELRAAEDAAPIGFVGINLRKSYNDRPINFVEVRNGRKRLWAAKAEDTGEVIYHDLENADFDPSTLTGGFGRDTIPGVDYPIYQGPDGSLYPNLRDRRIVFGRISSSGPRAYPLDLLTKVEVVNDRDGDTPIVLVFERGRGRLSSFRSLLNGEPITFGTTGYSQGRLDEERSPLLYDRRTKGLWLVRQGRLLLVSGKALGQSLEPAGSVEKLTWWEWRRRHRDSEVLMGNDRTRPIPSQ